MDLENLTGMVAAAHGFLSLDGDPDLGAVERSNLRQALGIEIEERALRLVAEVRRERGFGGFDDEDAASLVPEVEPTVTANGHAEPDEDERPLEGPFNPAQVRDLMLRYREGFIIPELAAELSEPYATVKKFVMIWAKSGALEETGYKVGRHKQYRYVPPTPKPVNRVKQTPPERAVDPAYSDRRATGEAVRVPAMARLTRQGRSTGGLAHKHRQRDVRYEKMQEAKEKRAREQQSKAIAAHMNGNGNGKKKK